MSLGFQKLNEKLSDTVVDRFASQCRNLKKLFFFSNFSNAADRLNFCELVVKLLDAQAHTNMQELAVRCFSAGGEGVKHSDVDQQVINSIVNSGFNQLSYLDLSLNYSWWQDQEIQE